MSKAAKTLDRILDGAISCYTRDGISKTSLDEVARAAGVGRTTLYRYIDNRDDLLAKVLLRDARLQQEELLILLRSHDNFASWLVDSMVHVMRARRTRPMNALLFGADSGGLLERISLEPANFYGVAEELLAPLFEVAQAQGQIREGVTLQNAARWTARIQLSLINYPEEFLEDEEALREYVKLFFLPSLVKDAG